MERMHGNYPAAAQFYSARVSRCHRLEKPHAKAPFYRQRYPYAAQDGIFRYDYNFRMLHPTRIVVLDAYALFPGLNPNIFMAGNMERLEAS
jgi:hypothetical protein